MNTPMNTPSPLLSRIRKVITESALIAFFAASTLVPTTEAAPPTMGVFITGADEAQHDRYEDYTQQRMSHLVYFGPGDGPNDTWEALTGRYVSNNERRSGHGLAWSVNRWDPPYRDRVVWSIPMLPTNGAPLSNNLASGANGSYDQQWRNVATTLIEAGYGDATLRIGWEFMGNWYRWSVHGTGWNGQPNTVNYREYWKRIVLAMRSVPGANFKFNWCGNPGDFWNGSVRINPADAYPDDDANGSYVDEIGIDIYDGSWLRKPNNGPYYYPVDPNLTQAQQDADRNTVWTAKLSWGTHHINWWTAFAASKGKPITVPEWGLNATDSERGGGDNPVFIQRFHEWAINPANNVKWHAYFQHDYSFMTQFFERNPGVFPRAETKFLQLFMGRPVATIFQNPVNAFSWTAGYGTRSITVVGTDNGHAPFEGAHHYKLTYTTNAGLQFAFSPRNLQGATHLSFAIKGPLTHSSQNLKVRLFAQDGSYGQLVTVPRQANYNIVDIPLSSLSSGLNLSQVNSIYFYATTAPVGTSDTVYLDSVQFIDTTR